ncbi:DNA-binding response regulator, OmpR family, contains REC and winged-helix (wHTH) domain [Clostridium sp. DSM 8431]|uniref:response regulator transcription factor n=1 Tax=Clostridium sp. DSM 8431 TaxID=1761781 RepID=UPI0008E18F59|nr:response regulator transcription factor [Clostridium sp. DSM 8431]SFU51107.1 DNA-binding response regulator, OmpR family, contains REC and winged-helix (wHTH) domain [Clostridium sp. DSM 8431]
MKKEAKILVVEDNDEINKILSKVLIKEGHNVTSAFSGTEALHYVKDIELDVILLDLIIPGMSGEELISKIREITNSPIIVISAKVDKKTKLDMLNKGADDFIEKPFDIDEVIARVNSNIRRYLEFSVPQKHSSILKHGDIALNRETKEVTISGKEIKLRLKEFEMLELFMMNSNKIFSKANLYESLWKEAYWGNDNLILVHLSRLRNKLSENTNEEYIETIWGIGYRLKKI